MFDFFKETISNIGIKLISNFSIKLADFIEEIIKKSKDGDENDNSGDDAQIGSSGYNAKIGSSGDDAQIGSSGYNAQIGSSGYNAKIGSSGYNAKIGSSGDDAQIGSSGYNAQIGSSGNYAQIGSSGDDAQIGSSGYNAKIGSSGNYAKIGSSGNYAQIGSSGYNAQIDISGKNSIGFACGYKSIIKAKKGTWISLAEYARNEDGKLMPVFAKSAQIGNKDYTDYSGKTLKSNTYYILWKKMFYPVDQFDGLWTIKLTEKKRDNITIIKAIDVDDILKSEIKEIYIAREGKLSAHGYTLREAIEDLTLKKLGNVNIDEIVSKIRETRKVTRSQYRAITGACLYGTNKFCEEHNIQDLEEISIDELRKILINDYGAKQFWKLIDNQ